MSTPLREQASPAGCLLRLFWFFVGNMLLASVGISLLFRKSAAPSLLDLYYWSVVIFILAARYVDVRFCQGATTDGKEATMQDWKQHAITLVMSAAVAWGLLYLKAIWMAG